MGGRIAPLPGQSAGKAGFFCRGGGRGDCGRGRGRPESRRRHPILRRVFLTYLLPGHWRGGIRRTLMDATARSLIDLGLSSMIDWFLPENCPARRFYEALGGKYFRGLPTEIAGSPLQEVSYGWPDLNPPDQPELTDIRDTQLARLLARLNVNKFRLIA